VSGLTPRSTVKEATTVEKVESNKQYDEFLSIIGDDNNNNANDNGVADDVDVDATISNVSDQPPTVQIVGDADEARGARRMAAMRRRRVKGGGGGSSKPVMAEDEKITTDETNTALGENIAAVKIGEEPMLVVEAEESSPTVVKTTNRVLESVTLDMMAKDVDINEEDIEQKKYMGEACMRRKRLKEEREKRLQEIDNDGDSPRSTVELIASLGGTATTIKKGVATVDVNGISLPASDDDGVATSSLASGDDGEAVCYLCLGGGADEADQPLRRDCACRGTDAGFVHLSCLTNYAETKSKQANDMKEFVILWVYCPSCHQEYQNELSIDIANKFVSFVRRQYPDDTHKQVESLNLKLHAFSSLLNRLKPVQKKEAGITANVLLSMIDRMEGEVSPLTMRYLYFKVGVYHLLGRIALSEKTKESARRAEAHFDNQLKVSIELGYANDIAHARRNIACAKFNYEGYNNEEMLKANQEMYESRVAERGEKNDYTIRAGKILAMSLQDQNRGGEARELLTKLLATSKQVYGAHHNTTKEIELELIKNEKTERLRRYMKLHETGSYSNEDVVTASQDIFELSQYGEEHEKTIHAGKDYAIALWKANRDGEASELLTNLLAMSLKILGPHHSTTKEISSCLQCQNGKITCYFVGERFEFSEERK
jgi:hypothetical protein